MLDVLRDTKLSRITTLWARPGYEGFSSDDQYRPQEHMKISPMPLRWPPAGKKMEFLLPDAFDDTT